MKRKAYRYWDTFEKFDSRKVYKNGRLNYQVCVEFSAERPGWKISLARSIVQENWRWVGVLRERGVDEDVIHPWEQRAIAEACLLAKML